MLWKTRPVKRLFGAKVFNIKLIAIQSHIFLINPTNLTETMNVFESVYIFFQNISEMGFFYADRQGRLVTAPNRNVLRPSHDDRPHRFSDTDCYSYSISRTTQLTALPENCLLEDALNETNFLSVHLCLFNLLRYVHVGLSDAS